MSHTKLTRYALEDGDIFCSSGRPYMSESESGDYVMYDDYKKLESRNAELVEALGFLMNDIGGGKKFCGHGFHCVCAWDKAKEALAKHKEAV